MEILPAEVLRFFRTQGGDLSYKNDPFLNELGLIFLRRTDGLVRSLNLDPNYQRIYEDELATNFVKRPCALHVRVAAGASMIWGVGEAEPDPAPGSASATECCDRHYCVWWQSLQE